MTARQRKQLSATDEQMVTDVTELLAAPVTLPNPTFVPPLTIARPGVYDMPAADYHRDPVPFGSLSQSGAKLLLKPSCPAKFKWALDNPDDAEPKDHFDFGAAAHTTVLSDGADIEVIDYADWRTNAAKDLRAKARADGLTPVLAKDMAKVDKMAEAIKDHPIAYRLLSGGKAEQSLFAIDPETGVWLRGRVDRLHTETRPGFRLLIPDYKSAADADNESFERAAYNNGYVIQAPWYSRLAELLGLAASAVMVFVAQEKTAPYLVNVVELTTIALEYGRSKMAEAIATYAQCKRSGYWPGYSDGIELIGLPRWVEREYLESR